MHAAARDDDPFFMGQRDTNETTSINGCKAAIDSYTLQKCG